MKRLALLAASALAGTLPAQFTNVIPNGTATTEGSSSTAYPWGRGASAIRVQYFYDTTHFTAQGITGPMRITRMRWRANGTATISAGGTYSGGVTILMSSSPLDYTAITTTFATNHGADLTTVYSGGATVAASAGTTPNNWYVDITLGTPFIYDPTLGMDLCVDVACDQTLFSGVTPTALDCATTGSATSRMFNLTSHTATTGTTQQLVGIVTELSWGPPAGLFAGFTATPTAGATPLPVQFTDGSFSSDPGGITSWAWDFENDGTVDSTVQNPLWTYTACGTYDVRLTVTDGSNPPSSLLKTAYVNTDVVTPSFTWAPIGGGMVQFTDTSTPTPTSWSWDLDGDNIEDSTAQNPTWAYGGCPVKVTLTVNRLCKGPYSTSQNVSVTTPFSTIFVSNNGGVAGTGLYFDINVTNPDGVRICALDNNVSAAVGTAFTLDVWQTPTTYVGKDTNIALWRKVATGGGTSAGTDQRSLVVLSSPLYVPAGSHGMAVYYSTTPRYTNGTGANQFFSNADLSLTLGIAHSSLFGGSLFTPRVWNGGLYYSTCTASGEGGYGFYGLGCAGSMGVTSLTQTAHPRLGQPLNVNLNNLPLSAAWMITGVSNTVASFGPLPQDLTANGLTGCSLRVSPDVIFPVAGVGNTATWSWNVPLIPALLCLHIHNQAVVPDPLFNPASAVLSDSADAILGN